MQVDDLSVTVPDEGAVTDTHQLAHDHASIAITKTQPLLLTQHQAHQRFLRQAYARFVQEAAQEMLSPAAIAEWLLDNFHIVQRNLRQIAEDMPATFYHQLPRLTTGSFANYPRVYAIAHTILAADDGRIDVENVTHFVQTYQEVTPLRMGELWALPVMLRLTIIEVLVHLVAQALETAAPQTAVVPSFITANTDSAVKLPGVCITSLRELDAQDWAAFFEAVNLVDRALAQDPADVYDHMEFANRDQCRKVVEQLAQATGQPEYEVAAVTVVLAQQAQANAPPDTQTLRQSHVGYYLLDAGRRQLEKALGYRPPAIDRLRRWGLQQQPTFTYLGSILLIMLVLLVGPLAYTAAITVTPWKMIVVALLTFIPATTIAISLVNWLVSYLVRPRLLPKLDLSDGVPASCQTMVVIPALLSRADEVNSLLRQLEQHYLRNSDPHIRFALLTDFTDSTEKQTAVDDKLLKQAKAGIRALNARYNKKPFYLFHRERLWNPQEEVWMGWERKRGKLEEFNRLLRQQDDTSDTSYVVQMGDLTVLTQIRYVITLDADTILPSGAARRLIGTLAHPLNQAEFAPDSDRVVAGYTVLQPRTEPQPLSAGRSHFTRIFGGNSGIDLYTHAVSDVYQDLFGEGIYMGKGIYDVDAFRRSLARQVPENSLLSHDLFEGIHGRAGLVSDITLYEDFPGSYLSDAARQHRWIRGDWQLLPWLLPRLSQNTSGLTPRRLSLINYWKMVDNMHRSLVPPALLTLLIVGWLWLPGSALFWTLLAILAQASVLVSYTLSTVFRCHQERSAAVLLQEMRQQVAYWALSLVFLPYEALINLDAILTTLVRLFITRKKLLQWITAAHTARLFGRQRKLFFIWRRMVNATLLALVLGVLVVLLNPQAIPVALPFLLAWFFSPQIAVWLGRPTRHRPEPLSAEQERELRRLARSSWLYFEHFVGPEDHWLPPDHFQEDPRGLVAHRTSPTNIGLMFLSTLTAYDFGYIGVQELMLRLQNSLQSLTKLEMYGGHFLNWYDTQTREPLPPRYVSTVDSGNLACCLWTMRQACLDIEETLFPRWQYWQGLLDTLDMLDASLPAGTLQTELRQIRQRILEVRQVPDRWAMLQEQIVVEVWPQFEQNLSDFVESQTLTAEELHSIRLWVERLGYHLTNMQTRLKMIMPWLLYRYSLPALFQEATDGTPLAVAWQALLAALPVQSRLADMMTIYKTAQAKTASLVRELDTVTAPADKVAAARQWCRNLVSALESGATAAAELLTNYREIGQKMDRLVNEMDFGFLYDRQRHIFRIGYNVDAEKLDPNYYDLLASEARAASLLAIAKGDVPQRHWLHLGRPLTEVNGRRSLISWSGTMFEYLMPALWTHHHPHTLLESSLHAAVDRQIAYVKDKDNVPWGISESGYYRFDANLNYQYRAFGVSGLGFKRGLEDDLVISPYASLLALPLRPQAVLENMQLLHRLGMMGDYGFYEAIDYTVARLGLNQKYAIVRSYMVHHQGMILLALANTLDNERMVHRFHAHPRIQSVGLLLQEQIPHTAPLEEIPVEGPVAMRGAETELTAAPWSVPVLTPFPQTHYLGNGRYGLLITNAGGGFDRWQEVDLTRWRADTTGDNWGTWIYLQDLDSGGLMSVSAQPVPGQTGQHDVTFAPHKADFQYSGEAISCHMEVIVAPSDDVAIRRVRLTNQSGNTRRLRLVSYGEIVLGEQAGDRRHPAFNKLFVTSSYLPEQNALLFTRRPRSGQENPPFMAHALVVETPAGTPLKDDQALTHAYETDRAHFLGRGGTLRGPAALTGNAPANDSFSATTGSVLDPIMCLAQEIDLAPHTSTDVVFLTLAAASRETALDLLTHYQKWANIEYAFQQAEVQSLSEIRDLGLDPDRLAIMQRLLGLLIYPHAALRANPETLAANRQGQTSLWSLAISGDYPILVAQVQAEEELALVRELLQAHAYWRNRGLKIDLVFMNEQPGGYDEDLQMQLRRLVERMHSDVWLNRRGGIFLVQSDTLNEGDRTLLLTAARVVLEGHKGSLGEQLHEVLQRPQRLPRLIPIMDNEVRPDMPPLLRPDDLLFDNGWGGFTPDGREYVIYLEPGVATPAPWSNVIANPNAGCLVTETGGGYTWAGNSGENRLTPWRNDPVRDQPGEVIYLRDEETGGIWSPTPAPCAADAPYRIHHGRGSTTFHHHSHGLKQQLRLFMAADDPVKIVQLQLENSWSSPRRLTVTYYAEWVLGVNRDEMQSYIIPSYESEYHALLVRNPYNAEFGERVAFLAASRALHGFTADRTEFLGELGDVAQPAALERVGLDGTVRPGLDPCAVLQLHVNLEPGETKTVSFYLGQAADVETARALIQRLQEPQQVEAAWEVARAHWDDLLTAVTVKTPNQAMDLLLNGWLLYQNISSRIWGRSAFYQSSGAYGFRDQLQDVLATLHAAPEIARQHILRAARHQFEAGDVLHWWHPPSGRGVRKRITDNLLWLPYVVAHYVQTTGDLALLQEEVPFRQGKPLQPDEKERYDHYPLTEEGYTIYEHCQRALAHGDTGPHDLPLMGGGDWNDGMNRVGIEGLGESVWLGWFRYATLAAFIPLCIALEDEALAAQYRQEMADLQSALEQHAWDGDWYVRAFYDDGTPLGSAQNKECQIDAIAQSWAVLSGAAETERAQRALAAVAEKLVREEERLLLLFTPPLDKTPRDPGYIKGYPPGVRENGGQYTHAAVWTIWAYARMGEGERVMCLFDLLNPINHSRTAEKAGHYRVEPYVVAADVYGVAPHTGRGGWTWYTGSSGWLYRLGLEGILGLHRVGQTLRIEPCIPPDWEGYEIVYGYGRTNYHIHVKNSAGVQQGVAAEVWLDGERLTGPEIPLQDDGKIHQVEVMLGPKEFE
jgi:cyclic beta-1,2-glucan synthetase